MTRVARKKMIVMLSVHEQRVLDEIEQNLIQGVTAPEPPVGRCGTRGDPPRSNAQSSGEDSGAEPDGSEGSGDASDDSEPPPASLIDDRAPPTAVARLGAPVRIAALLMALTLLAGPAALFVAIATGIGLLTLPMLMLPAVSVVVFAIVARRCLALHSWRRDSP